LALHKNGVWNLGLCGIRAFSIYMTQRDSAARLTTGHVPVEASTDGQKSEANPSVTTGFTPVGP